MSKKTLGVLGGMGPAASARFYSLLTEFTKATCDSEHMEILLHSFPQIPDRTAFILGKCTQSPLPEMSAAIAGIISCGADIIAIPCNTAEYFHAELQAVCPVPILRTAYLSARFACLRGVKKLGILATDGTVSAGIYQEHLKKLGVGFALPCEKTQSKISELIYAYVKGSITTDNRELLRAAIELREKGCDAAVLGCTELSLIPRGTEEKFFIDSLSVLAAACVSLCGYPLSAKGKLYSANT